ncbi:unnamed protein product, partial [Cladocopium goreaui]
MLREDTEHPLSCHVFALIRIGQGAFLVAGASDVFAKAKRRAVQLQLQSEKKSLQHRATWAKRKHDLDTTWTEWTSAWRHNGDTMATLKWTKTLTDTDRRSDTQNTFEVKELEEALEKLKTQMDEAFAALVKSQAEEAAKLAADSSKMIVETESLKSMSQSLEDKNTQIEQVQAELSSLKSASAEQQEELQKAESRYQQLLQNTAMQSTGMPGAAPRAQTKRQTGQRNVFIQLAGAQSTGKTSLLESLISEYDPQQLPKFNEQKTNFLAHHQVKVGEKTIAVLDCSGNSRAAHLVKERFNRSLWVFIVYDLAKKESLDYALALMQEVLAGTKGTKTGKDETRETWGDLGPTALAPDHFSLATSPGMQPSRLNVRFVDVAAAKDAAVRAEGQAMESSSLMDAVKFAISSEEAAVDGQGVEAVSPDGKRSSISKAIDSMKSWFGQDRPKGSKGVLRPSLKGTKGIKQVLKEGDLHLRPAQELQDSESAVTCICFGQERLHKGYLLLATASKDGTVVVYRCYRTEMEIAMLADQDFSSTAGDPLETPPADQSKVAVHSRLVGHARAITSLFFTLLEDQLVTTSIDKSVRFWSVDSGEMLKVFTDSSPVPVATFLPFNPQVFVAANSNAVLRLVHVANGTVLQKLKVETEVRALKFDDTGLFLLAGTKSGSIHVLEAADSSTLKFKFK